MGKNIARTITGLDVEIWRQFTYWTKRLGYKQATFLQELMRYYFEHNKVELEKKLNTFTISVEVKQATKNLTMSAFCQQDIDRVRKEFESPSRDWKKIDEMCVYLTKEYLSPSNEHSKYDKDAVRDLLAQISEMEKVLKGAMK